MLTPRPSAKRVILMFSKTVDPNTKNCAFFRQMICNDTIKVIDGAGDAIRTRDIFLGKEVLYH